MIKNGHPQLLIFLGLGFLPSAIQNYLPNGPHPIIVAPIEEDYVCIKKYLSNLISPILCLGWSLGGKWALELYLEMPEKFEHLYLLNQAPCWPMDALEKEETSLRQSSVIEYLNSFYMRCFRGAPEARNTFMVNNYENHIERFTSQIIEKQLKNLGNYRLDDYLPFGEKVTFLHTRYDAIAPLSEMIGYCQDNNLRYHVLSSTKSHFPFNKQELWKYILS